MIAVWYMMAGKIHIPLASKGRRLCWHLVETESTLLSMSRFLVEVEREDRVYALLPCGNSAVDEASDLPLEV